MIYYARENQKLIDHLTAVADLAKAFANVFGCGTSAYFAGMLHDLGKYTHTFYDFSGYDTF